MPRRTNHASAATRDSELRHRRPFESKIAAVFVVAVDRLRASVPATTEDTDIVGAAEAIDVDGILDAYLTGLVADLLADAVKRGVREGDAQVKAGQHFQWTLVDQIAHEWAQQQAGTLVTAVSARTRAAIRDVLSLGIRENHTIAEIASNLRRTIGLTPRDAKAITRMRAALVRSGVSPAAAEKRVAKRSDAMVRRRAETIARTETAAAIEQGKLAEWRIAVQAGELPSNVRRKWVCGDACPLCRELARGKAVPLGQPFTASSGQSFTAPPAHPRCRCSVALQFGASGKSIEDGKPLPEGTKIARARFTPVPFKVFSWTQQRGQA